MIHEEIILVAEHLQQRISPITYELISFADEIKRFRPGIIITIVIIGKGFREIAGEIIQKSGINVICIECENLHLYNAEAYILILKEFISEKKVKYICIPHTSTGLDYAPGLAVKLHASCITGIEKCHYREENIIFTRSILNGKIQMEATPTTEVSVLTILPGSFKAPGFTKSFPYSPKIVNTAVSPCKTKTIKILNSNEDDPSISEADIIVSAGRGIGREENLNIIYNLAKIFPRSAIGGSRTICDIGWLGYKHQIGITGKSVAPKLYIACGISGAIQHVSSIKGANIILAINTDPQAAIFNYSDYCVVEDLTTFIPILIDAFKKKEKPHTFSI